VVETAVLRWVSWLVRKLYR